jgi:hypothetical protein
MFGEVKPISLYIDEQQYGELKSAARRQGRPVAELLREAMAEYIERQRAAHSMGSLPPHGSGAQLRRSATRSELLDEMRRRGS